MRRHQELLDKFLEETADGNLEPLFEELGRRDPETAGMAAQDLCEIVHAGKIWWQVNAHVVREMVCTNQSIQALAKNEGTKDLVLAIAAALDKAFGDSYAVPIAVLVLRLGVGKWCKWSAVA